MIAGTAARMAVLVVSGTEPEQRADSGSHFTGAKQLLDQADEIYCHCFLHEI
jgi:hypothetical protein